jgi:SAM-dependent methyltransferase
MMPAMTTPVPRGTKRGAGFLTRRRGEAVRVDASPPSSDAAADALPERHASNSRYAPLWNPSSEADAIRQIYNTDNEDAFEQGGRWDFDRLAPWFDESSTVLDRGIGRVARFVAPKCARLWAVDVSQAMLDMTAERLGHPDNVSYAICQDVTFSDVPSGSVDLAYSLLVLQHVEREDAFLLLEELRRVIRPTGTVVVNYPNLLSDTYLECFVEYAHNGAAVEASRARLYTPQEVERVMGAAGFRAELQSETNIRVLAHPA